MGEVDRDGSARHVAIMLFPNAKLQAYAAMDDAASFRLVAATPPPTGDVVVTLAEASSVEDLKPAMGLVRKMARTFFSDKFDDTDPRPDLEGPVALYVVCVQAELVDEAIEGLSEDGSIEQL
jgi:hypothetical protein